MSHEERLAQVEREQVRQGVEIATVGAQVREVGSDVKQLLSREAGRGAPVSIVTVLATLTSLGGAAAVVWWLIGTSPAVQELARRVDRLDDPQIGRVPSLEKKMETLTGWQPVTISRGR